VVADPPGGRADQPAPRVTGYEVLHVSTAR